MEPGCIYQLIAVNLFFSSRLISSLKILYFFNKLFKEQRSIRIEERGSDLLKVLLGQYSLNKNNVLGGNNYY